MKLDNDNIFVGDRVFDISINRGYGIVTTVYENSIEVKFERFKGLYDEKGFQFGKNWKTLFWNKPLVVAPSKDEVLWSKKQELVESFMSIVDHYKDI